MTEAEAIENIDIGGPTMIRAAAKNHDGVAVVVQPGVLRRGLAELEESGGEISAETRHWLANEAFAQTARYDAAISRWFSRATRTSPNNWLWPTRSSSTSPTARTRTSGRRSTPRPGARRTSSRGSRSCTAGRSPSTTCSTSTRRGGCSDDFDEPACVIVKHNNPCGVAIGEDVGDAYEQALACDPISAFGGVIALNRPVERRWPSACTRTSSRC